MNEAVQIYRDRTTQWIYTLEPEDFQAIYSVSYSANGAESGDLPVDTELYFRGDTLTVQGDTDTLSKTDYIFSQWNTQADGGGTSYNFGDTLTIGSENVTLYAVFLPEQCTGLSPADGSATNSDWPVLSWDSIPAAASYEVQIINAATGLETLDAAPLTATATNSLTTSSANAPGAFFWYWRVRGVEANGAKGPWSEVSQLTVGWYRHSVVLTGPDTNTTTTDTTPQLSWNVIDGTVRYEMQMANTNGAVAGATVQSMEEATSWIPDDALDNKADYFWRIRAVTTDAISGSEVTSTWSTINKFRVQWGLEGPLDGIRFPKELAQLASDNTLLSGSYVLNADLDLSGYTNWTPIGTASNKFTGTFNGNGRTISGLKITGSSSERGLFGYTGSGSHIQNVSLTGVSVAGGQNTGALIGYCEGNVSNCNASGTVSDSGSPYVGGLIGRVLIPATGSGMAIRDSWTNVAVSSNNYYVGGLIGELQGRNLDNMVLVEHCYAQGTVNSDSSHAGGLIGSIRGYSDIRYSRATGNVSGSVNSENVGGLVGTVICGSSALDVFITNSHATGTVSGYNYCGGLVGGNGIYSSNSGTGARIKNCYATGNVRNIGAGTYTRYIGGLIGYNYGNSVIEDSYARGNVTFGTGGSGSSLGGLVGVNTVSASIIRSYSTGLVTAGTSNVGGLVGRNSNATVTASYYDRDTSGRTDTGKGSPQYTSEMKTQATFAGWDFTGDTAAGTEPVWAIDPFMLINNGYPYLVGNAP